MPGTWADAEFSKGTAGTLQSLLENVGHVFDVEGQTVLRATVLGGTQVLGLEGDAGLSLLEAAVYGEAVLVQLLV